MSVCESNGVITLPTAQIQANSVQTHHLQLQQLKSQQGSTQHHHQSTQSIADYLAQLLKDRKQLAAFPNVFNHVERLLDEGRYIAFYGIIFSFLFMPV